VHARAQEEAFVQAGHARERYDLMYNDFVIVGPVQDPAGAATAADVAAALKAVARSESTFVSRGDKSGTHSKELALWASAGITPTIEAGWYLAIGQGMGDTLIFANEKGAYTLADRGTWLATASKLRNLKVVLGGYTLADNKDRALLNPYGIMAVSPDQHPGVRYEQAMHFVQWLKSVEIMGLVASYGVERYEQPLFYPDSAEYRASGR
jgi:tungstate transport system substrate-binding protein